MQGRKTNVAQFIPEMFDNGAETLVKNYCKIIDYNDFNHFVFTVFENKDCSNYKEISTTKTKYFSIYHKKNLLVLTWNKFLKKFWVPHKLLSFIRKNQIDVLHVHLALLRFVKPIAKRIKNVKLLYTCHSLPSRYFTGINSEEFIAAKYLLKNNALQLIALQDDMKSELNKIFNIKNTIVLNNGIDLRLYAYEHKEYRTVLGIPNDAYVIGHIGRFDPLKNHDFLVDVFLKAVEKNTNSFLLLVGAGPEKEKIIKRLEDCGLTNRYLILSNRSDIPYILKTMNVFAFPSKFEGLGIAFIEAQASNIPCVVSTSVPKQAYVSDIVTALSLTESIDIWADCLLHPIANVSKCSDINTYDMRNEIKKLQNLYKGGKQ